MKNILKTLIACLLTCTLGTGLFAGIEKINDGLYVGKKNGLNFGFERVTSETVKFWKEYSKTQKKHLLDQKKLNYDQWTMIDKNYYSYKQLLNSEEIEKLNDNNPIKNDFIQKKEMYKKQQDNYLKRDEFLICVEDGIDAFNDFLHYYKKEDIWIAYATEKNITAESVHSLKTTGDIEISCGVATNNKIPFSTHMGIFRSLDLNETSKHRKLAMDLHSFAAQTTQQVYGNKEYMITTPLEGMRQIIVKNLPKEAVWKNEEKTTLLKNDKKITVVSLSEEKPTFQKPAFLNSYALKETWAIKMIVIDIKALANFMKLD